MKPLRRLRALLLAAVLLAATGCSSAPQPAGGSPSPSGGGTVVYTDSTGRAVEVPSQIERIAPSGPLAQVVLYTLCPDKLVGLAAGFSDSQAAYVDEKYQSLPVLGNFYADTLNLEAVLQAGPQVVIDLGEVKATAGEDMQGVQDKTGIPSVFLHMEPGKMADAYRALGALLGVEERAEQLAVYIEDTLREAEANRAAISEAERVSVYCGQGDAGLSAVVRGSSHAVVIEIVGAVNVAEVTGNLRGGVSDVSMEQLLLWQPDVVLFVQGSLYDEAQSRAEWQALRAVQSGAVYEIPVGPYDWMGRPPSVNQILGIKWLGNLLYPALYSYDMAREVKDFYELFYHVALTDEQAASLLARASGRD